MENQSNWRTGGISRRGFSRLCARSLGVLTLLVSGCNSMVKHEPFVKITCDPSSAGGTDFEYVVVGSGAGGGPLAANLAKAGHRVLLLEAGGEEEPFTYQVPVFHPLASEEKSLRWDFFVKHYGDLRRQRRDDKYIEEKGGVLYPRAGTLGGCTAHYAMIMVYPHNSDWDEIERITGDASWGAENMRKYFQRLERCQYVERPERPEDNRSNVTRHGFDGWLTTNTPSIKLLLKDGNLLKISKAAAKESFRSMKKPVSRLYYKLKGYFDPNDWRLVKQGVEGIMFTPLAVNEGKRSGTRGYIRRVQAACPDNLVVRTGALATRVLFDGENAATGVEYLSGRHLYRADPSAGEPGVRHRVRATREVILCGGAFNSPQLLKLSGIGPKEELAKLGIPVRVDLPGVGENLQDRYEVGVVSEMKEDFALLEGATFAPPHPQNKPDPLFSEWWLSGTGVYTTNGAVVSMIKRSAASRPEPDLYLFGVPGFFRGYFPGYSKLGASRKNFFTWVVLKAHTRNAAGRVTLKSKNPLDVPDINFHYFDEGNDKVGEDLESVVEGVETVRRIMDRTTDLIKQEVVPGPKVRTRAQIAQFIKDNAWGHHASCSNKIGSKSDSMAVLDSNFQVHGTKRLRVVDASVFPRIPGMFIVSAIFMISEKASEVILAAAKKQA